MEHTGDIVPDWGVRLRGHHWGSGGEPGEGGAEEGAGGQGERHSADESVWDGAEGPDAAGFPAGAWTDAPGHGFLFHRGGGEITADDGGAFRAVWVKAGIRYADPCGVPEADCLAAVHDEDQGRGFGGLHERAEASVPGHRAGRGVRPGEGIVLRDFEKDDRGRWNPCGPERVHPRHPLREQKGRGGRGGDGL